MNNKVYSGTDYNAIKFVKIIGVPVTITENSENYGVRENLGLTADSEKENYKTTRFCGCCHLKDKDGNFIITDDGEKAILSIESRFDGLKQKNNAILDMLNAISEDDEFDDYLCMNLPEGERLITYFFDEDLIFADEITKDNKMLTYISFIHLVLNSTKRGLMSKMVKRSENLTGKVRGKIDVKYQISKNIMRGRKDRIYCKYSEKSVDILENQILKYALAIISDSKIAGLKNLQRSINILKRRFSAVSDRKVTPAEIDRIILPSMYQSYKPMFQFAKVIISDISMYTTGNGSKKGLVPYAINMPLLFECYARSLIKKGINRINNNKKCDYYIEMKKFVADKNNDKLNNLDSSYGCRRVADENCYIQGYVVPDIVLAYHNKKKWDKGEIDSPMFYRVYDVKYKITNNNPNRDDRLQFLAYCFMYGVKGLEETKDLDNIHWYSGLIFPKQDVNDENRKYIFTKMNTNSENDVYFHQYYIGSTGIDFGWLEK